MFAVLILYDIIREANVKIAADMWARNTHGAKKEKRKKKSIWLFYMCKYSVLWKYESIGKHNSSIIETDFFFFSIYDYFKFRKEKYICTNAYVYVH